MEKFEKGCYIQYADRRQKMGEQLLTLYNSLTLEAQKQLYEFASFLASKAGNIKKTKNSDSSDFFGALHKYANPDLIEKEKSAWADSVSDKYRRLNDN